MPAPQSITLFRVCSGWVLKQEKTNLKDPAISVELKFANPPKTPLQEAQALCNNCVHTIQYEFALLYQFSSDPTGSITLPPLAFLLLSSISHISLMEGQLKCEITTYYDPLSSFPPIITINKNYNIKSTLISQHQFLIKLFFYQFWELFQKNRCIMYNDQAQEGGEEHVEKCQLCLNQVSAEKTYAGVFHRICIGCYQLQIEDLEQPIHFISEGIYIGNDRASRNENLLRQHKIGAICVCGSDLKVHEYEQLKPEKRVVKILDTATQNLIDFLPDVIQWLLTMNKKKVNVLVHCAGGVSRSASICIAFFMKKNKLSFQDSYLLVKRSRKCVKPNQNFVKQLKNYEKSISG